jgi:hypothetical protein
MPGTSDTRNKWALLIGIDEYPYLSKKHRRLYGCVNDVDLMYCTLRDNFGFPENNIVPLTNKDAYRMLSASARVGHRQMTVPGRNCHRRRFVASWPKRPVEMWALAAGYPSASRMCSLPPVKMMRRPKSILANTRS